jgi:hypothetical protein
MMMLMLQVLRDIFESFLQMGPVSQVRLHRGAGALAAAAPAPAAALPQPGLCPQRGADPLGVRACAPGSSLAVSQLVGGRGAQRGSHTGCRLPTPACRPLAALCR